MSEAAYIITPAGSVVAASGGGNPVLSGNTVTWNGHVEVLASADVAQIYFDNLTNLISQQTTVVASGFTKSLFLPVLYGISPNSFEMPTAAGATPFVTTHLTIHGAGFLPDGSYLVGVEDDITTPMVINGYRLTAVYVNQNTLIVDAGNSGDAGLPDGPCYIFISDGTNNSNNIVGLKTSGPGYPVITIPE